MHLIIYSSYPDIPIDIGGSGYDLHKTLPDEIENLKPDYTLYPESDYSIGFSSRVCFRKCHFCIVHEKEGQFRRVQHPQQWHNPEYNKIVFLDNNILTDKKWFMKVTNWCLEAVLKFKSFLQLYSGQLVYFRSRMVSSSEFQVYASILRR
jgi:hypothetical protein